MKDMRVMLMGLAGKSPAFLLPLDAPQAACAGTHVRACLHIDRHVAGDDRIQYPVVGAHARARLR